jgi:hypothetical protein
MNDQKDFEEFFALLTRERVKFLLVGGYALAYHGHPRYTGVVDIFVEASITNARRLMNTVEKFGFKNTGIAQEDFLQKDKIIQLGYPPNRIDIIASIDGIEFKDGWKNRIKDKFGSQSVFVISRKDLIKNKRTSGRPRDLLDLELLEKPITKKRQRN